MIAPFSLPMWMICPKLFHASTGGRGELGYHGLVPECIDKCRSQRWYNPSSAECSLDVTVLSPQCSGEQQSAALATNSNKAIKA